MLQSPTVDERSELREPLVGGGTVAVEDVCCGLGEGLGEARGDEVEEEAALFGWEG